MRLLITADLHYNHARGKALADALIDEMNAAGGDVLLVVGDTAAFDGDALEQCLSRFRFRGPKLFIAGNHELWTRGQDSHHNFREALPQRVGALGWQWLQSDPFISDQLAIIGSIGWYDYSMAQASLGIPRRFYAAKLSPGAASMLDGCEALLEPADSLSPQARQVVARWNDGKFVKLHRSDEQFLDELLTELAAQLDSLRQHRRILAAIHHLPFAELLPPSRNAQWDFAKAYLGSTRIGELLSRYTNLATVVCGHSHFPAEARVGHIRAINIGSGYRQKHYLTLNTETDLA
jgi:Icc-related predicted phosphoesterase